MVNDLGAVLVIAILYTQTINFIDLMIGDFFLVVLVVANLLGVRKTSIYATVGFLGVWLAFLFSGVHATIAGVLIAFTIPARTKIGELEYLERLFALTRKFKDFKPS